MASSTHLYAADYRWYTHHIADITRDYDGTLWTQSTGWIKNTNEVVDPGQWGIKVLDSVDQPGLSREQGVLHRGGNSGYQAINLAYLWGATRIILIGYDMMMNGTQRHWFGDHPGTLNAGSNYHDFGQAYKTIKPEDYGIEIWNCSRRTALDCFPIYDLDEVLAAM